MAYRIAKFLVNAVAPAFGLLVSLWLCWNIETRFFPVVEGFRVTEITRTADGYLTSGELTKSRNCEFLGLTLYAHTQDKPKLLVAQYKKDIFGSDVGVGHQTWGPWLVTLPPKVVGYEHLEILGTHRCHALWLQSTMYYQFDLRRLPNG